MTKRADLQKQIDKAQAQLNTLERVPEDKFPFGTVAVFSTAEGIKWYIVKVAEEAWRNMLTGNSTRTLEDHILEAVENEDTEYFEVYILKAESQPFFASS